MLGVSLVGAAIVSGYAMIGAGVGLFRGRHLAAPHYLAALDASALRGKGECLHLSEAGVTLSERHLTWRDISGHLRHKSFTIILASPADGLVIPDRDLPPGMIPEDLARLVDGWRAAARSQA